MILTYFKSDFLSREIKCNQGNLKKYNKGHKEISKSIPRFGTKKPYTHMILKAHQTRKLSMAKDKLIISSGLTSRTLTGTL
jgi:hypothetical protein